MHHMLLEEVKNQLENKFNSHKGNPLKLKYNGSFLFLLFFKETNQLTVILIWLIFEL